jgi:large subunit ribosomal protein L5
MEDNKMREIKVEKLTINIGSGSEDSVNNNAKKLLKVITGKEPSPGISKKRLPAFKISKGQAIAAYVTVRGADIKPLAEKLFDAVQNRIKDSGIRENTASFGIHEYIDIRGVKYDPKIGMLGMNVNLSFKRAGARVALRKRRRASVPERHRVVSREEIKQYLKQNFKVEAQ